MTSFSEVHSDFVVNDVPIDELIEAEKFVNVIIQDDSDSGDSNIEGEHSLNVNKKDGSNSLEISNREEPSDMLSSLNKCQSNSSHIKAQELPESRELKSESEVTSLSGVLEKNKTAGTGCIGEFYCPNCKYSTRLRGDLNRHIASIHIKDKPYHCTECNYKTSQKCHLNTHIKSVHIKEKSHQCVLCHYKCSRKSSLNRHIMTIHKVKGEIGSNPPMAADICKKEEPDLNNIAKGERTNQLDNGNSFCNNILEPASSGGALVNPVRSGLMAQAESVKLVNGVFQCPSCVYCTKWKGDLYRHVAFIHIGDKPYHCPECNYQAKQKTHLNIHIKSVHLKDKSFQCPDCEYQCSRRGSLNRHIMTIHKGEKPFLCPECHYQASQSGNLKHHLMIVHRGEKPFHCPHCSFQATKRDSVNKHIKSAH